MVANVQKQGSSLFERIRKVDDNGGEYWSARDLSKALEYSDYRNFLRVVEKAKESCKNSIHALPHHFVDVNDMAQTGLGASREIDDIKLSRYACYLVVQNADPSKETVAMGQTYFAIQTRLNELRQTEEYNRLNTEDEKRLFLRNELVTHNIQLAAAAKDAGVVEPLDYAIFQNHGYKGLYGGLDARSIHQRKNLKKSQNILDHMGSTELAANLFRATQTEEKLRRENIKGKTKANQTHYNVGRKVRQTIKELGGTMPENLPIVQSIKQIGKTQESKQIDKHDE